MNYKPFFDELMATEPTNKYAQALMRRAELVFSDDEISPDDPQTIAQLFIGVNGRASASQAQHIKRYIIQLYHWLGEHGEVSHETVEYVASLTVSEAISLCQLTTSFFGSLDSLLNYINIVGATYGLGSDEDQPRIKSIAILAWYGFKPEDMVVIKKTDLNPEDCTVALADQRIQMSPNHFALLQKCADIDNYPGLPSGRIQRSKPSRYVLRNQKNSQVTVASVVQAIKYFNNFAVEYGQKLHCGDITRSGLMYSIWEQSTATGKPPRELLRQRFPTKTPPDIYRDMVLYKQWVATFKT